MLWRILESGGLEDASPALTAYLSATRAEVRTGLNTGIVARPPDSFAREGNSVDSKVARNHMAQQQRHHRPRSQEVCLIQFGHTPDLTTTHPRKTVQPFQKAATVTFNAHKNPLLKGFVSSLQAFKGTGWQIARLQSPTRDSKNSKKLSPAIL